MTVELLQLKAAVVGAWFALFFVLERVAAVASSPASNARLVKNGALWLLNTALSPLIVIPLAVFASAHALWVRPGWMTSLLWLAVDLVVLDLWTYWVHRAYHKTQFMWRLHEVHHRDEHLDTTSAVRFHFGEVLLSAGLRMAPIIIFAVPLSTVILFEALMLAAAIFHHSNLRIPARLERILSAVIVTPSIHWVHHHAVQSDTDSNYATVLSIWDRLFASKSETQRSPTMKIGAEGVEDEGFLRLLLMPVLGSRR